MTLLDKDIREPLFEFLEREYGVVRFLEEKVTGRTRADALMVTDDSIHGIEIKSDADTYERLKKQVRYYNRYCDRCWIAAGARHSLHVGEHVPAWWGIIIVDTENGKPDFYIRRRALPNPKPVIREKLSLLWRPELAAIQAKCGLPAYKQKSKEFAQEKILEKIEEQDLHREISAALFERDYTLIEKQISDYKKENGRQP